MVTGREIEKAKEELAAMQDRDKRDREYQAVQEEKRKLQMGYQERHMTTFERGLKALPSQIKKDIESLHKTATSPSSKKKISRIRRMLDI